MKHSSCRVINKKQTISRLLICCFLTFALVLSGFSINALNVFAVDDSASVALDATSSKSVNLGSSAIAVSNDGWNKSDGSYVNYGTYNNTPIKFRVLSKTGDTLLLDCDSILWMDEYHALTGDEDLTLALKEYSTSDIRVYLKDAKDNNNVSLLTDKEKANVTSTNLSASSPKRYRPEGYGNVGDETVYFEDDASDGNYMFPLTTGEAYEFYPVWKDAWKSVLGSTDIGPTWTRSACWENESVDIEEDNIGLVISILYPNPQDEGTGLVMQSPTSEVENGVSPAMNLKIDNVMMTSDASFNKSGAVTKVSSTSSKEWNLTYVDNSLTATVERGTLLDDTMTIPYTVSGDGATQMSVMITSGDKDAEGTEVLAYGKMADVSGASGTGTFTMPSDLPDGFKVYVLAENASGTVDFASVATEVSYDTKYTVSFETNGGTPAIESQIVDEGKVATEPEEELTKENNTFDGWYSDSSFEGEQFDFETPITQTTTLYAKWNANSTEEETKGSGDSNNGGDGDAVSPTSTSTLPSTGDIVNLLLCALALVLCVFVSASFVSRRMSKAHRGAHARGKF